MVAVHDWSENLVTPEDRVALARLATRAEYLGLVQELPESSWPGVLEHVLRGLESDRIGRLHVLTIRSLLDAPAPPSPESEPTRRDTLTKSLIALMEEVEGSPTPETAWKPMREALGDDLLADLLGISPSSLHRYGGGNRRTPDDVAARLHSVALITADLAGGYNEYGIRRWFRRPRTALGGRTPAEVLRNAEDIDAPDVRKVAGLAAWLVGAGSAA